MVLAIDPNARYWVRYDPWVGDWGAYRYTPDGEYDGRDFESWHEAYAYAYSRAAVAVREVP